MELDFRVPEICNYYGTLTVFKMSGKYFWGIENYDGEFGEMEIPEYLYKALSKYVEET